MDWRNIKMSRAASANCGQNQTAESFDPKLGASLALKLVESERECKYHFLYGYLPHRFVPTIHRHVIVTLNKHKSYDT